jgi:hypothetical protein
MVSLLPWDMVRERLGTSSGCQSRTEASEMTEGGDRSPPSGLPEMKPLHKEDLRVGVLILLCRGGKGRVGSPVTMGPPVPVSAVSWCDGDRIGTDGDVLKRWFWNQRFGLVLPQLCNTDLTSFPCNSVPFCFPQLDKHTLNIRSGSLSPEPGGGCTVGGSRLGRGWDWRRTAPSVQI